MSPELQAIVTKHREQEREKARVNIRALRIGSLTTTAIAGELPYLPDLVTGVARWLGRDAFQVGKNVIGLDGAVRA